MIRFSKLDCAKTNLFLGVVLNLENLDNQT